MEVIAWIFGPLWLMTLTTVTVLNARVTVELKSQLERKPWIGTSRVVESPQDRLQCGCKHHFAFHDRRTGRCEEQVAESRFNDRRGQSETSYRRCRCRGYTGVVPPSAGSTSGDDKVTRLADGTVLTWPWNHDAGTEVVQWEPPSSRRSAS